MSNIIPLPPLDPAPPAKAAALMVIECPECEDEPRGDCRTCAGSGCYEVCSGCMQRPWLVCGVEQCVCSTPGVHASEATTEAYVQCETCERYVLKSELDNANVCETCRSEMAEIIKHEPEEPVVVLHDEVRWALEATDWLTTEGAAA